MPHHCALCFTDVLDLIACSSYTTTPAQVQMLYTHPQALNLSFAPTQRQLSVLLHECRQFLFKHIMLLPRRVDRLLCLSNTE